MSLESIQLQKHKRANLTARRASLAGVVIAVTACIAAVFLKEVVIFWSNLLIVAGFAISLLLSRRFRGEKFIWQPGFLSLWLSSFPINYVNEGFMSPVYGLHMVLIFALGLVIQIDYSQWWVLGMILFNFLIWLVITALGLPLGHTKMHALEFSIPIFLFVAGISSIFWAFTTTQSELESEAMLRNAELQDTVERLMHAGKMAEIGELVASTAHELAQPIQGIVISSAVINRLCTSGAIDLSVLRSCNSDIKEAAKRLMNLINFLRTFARNDTLQTEVFDLREAIHAVEKLSWLSLKNKKMTLSVQAPDEPLWIEADLLQIQQVFLNLMNNARDACSDTFDASITITLSQQKGFSRISFRNNGPPIALPVQKVLFKNYFTTKPRGKGTGIGLKICDKLLGRNRGRIWFCSDETETLFVVDFDPAIPERKEITVSPLAVALLAEVNLQQESVL